MHYKILLMLFIILTPLSHALAQEAVDRYRIELIVLLHLDHREEAFEVDSLVDYSSALDFLAPPTEQEEDESDPDDAATTQVGDERPASPGAEAVNSGETGPGIDLEAGPEEEAEPISRVTHVPELGEQMQDAWRRLRLSGPFRPLQSLAWEQDVAAPFPTLRLHDDVVVLVEDPWAEERAALDAAGTEAPGIATAEPGPARPPQPESPAAVAQPGAPEGEEALPPALSHYRLDGTATLTRSRFLHLALSLELREPVFRDTLPGDAAAASRLAPPDPAADTESMEPPVPDAFRVYRLDQTRQVRTGRMEYFDGPVLGVLAWITRVRAPEDQGDDQEPAPGQSLSRKDQGTAARGAANLGSGAIR